MAKRTNTVRRKSAGRLRKPKSGSLISMGSGELARELKRRKVVVSRLLRKRERLAERIAEIEAAMIGLGGAVLAGKRPQNESNLADALAKLLKGNPLNVTDAAEKVQEAGYRTTSPNFRTIVNQALINDKRFKRVSRGVYRA